MPRTGRRVLWLTLFLILLTAAAYFRFRGMPADILTSLQTADRFELLSLDPELYEVQHDPAETPAPPGSLLHKHTILGSTLITSPATRAELISALQSGVRGYAGNAPRCFSPRHALRIAQGSGPTAVTTDIVICFECHRVQVYRNNDITLFTAFTTTDSPASIFNAALSAANVPLPPPSP